MDKSSTFLALLAIISILSVTSVVTYNVSETSIRKPFAGSSAKVDDMKIDKKYFSEDSGESLSENLNDLKVSNKTTDPFDINTATNKKLPANNDTHQLPNSIDFKNAPIFDVFQKNEDISIKDTVSENLISVYKPVTEQTERQAIIKKISNEKVTLPGPRFSLPRLKEAGFQNAVIQKRPFNGIMFEEIDISSMESFSPVYAIVTDSVIAKSFPFVLRLYAFENLDKSTASEIFDLIKYKFEGNLGTVINETNEVGMGSFYINFLPPSDFVFLVVKYQNSVYALNYPKTFLKSYGVSFHEIFKKLL